MNPFLHSFPPEEGMVVSMQAPANFEEFIKADKKKGAPSAEASLSLSPSVTGALPGTFVTRYT